MTIEFTSEIMGGNHRNQQDESNLSSGNDSHSCSGLNHHAINGKTHCIDWAIFNSYVKLPGGRWYIELYWLVVWNMTCIFPENNFLN